MFKKILEDWKFAIGLSSIGFILISVLLSLFIAVGIKNNWNEGPVNTIVVRGKAEIKTTPNIANFDFTVTEVAESVELAQKNSTEKINKAISFLESNGIDKKDTKNSSYTVNPKYEWIQGVCNTFRCNPSEQKLIGYEVSQSINVKVRETKKLGELISGVGSLGITNIGSVYFTSGNIDQLKKDGILLAIDDSRNKASELAERLGIKITKVVSFSEENYYQPYMNLRGGAEMKSMDVASVPAQIPIGENTIEVSVNVVYQIR